MQNEAIYKNLAEYYDLIYSWKNYSKESNKITKLIKKYKRSNGNKLLEVGCGTGKHLAYFKKDFECTGVDLNQGILDIAKRNVNGVKFLKANMINMDLKEKFDVVTSLFSAIGYVKTYNNLKRTILTFNNHMETGGVLIIEPWLSKEKYKSGKVSMHTYETDDVKISRVSFNECKNNVSILNMHYLIGKKNEGIIYAKDKHELGLFDSDKTLDILKDNGFNAKFLLNGLMKDRGLFIAVKE